MRYRFLHWTKLVFCLLLVLGISLASVGCNETFRRKFVRESKNKTSERLVLKTEDMEADPSTDRYQKHYSFWRLWHKDMIQTLQDSMNSRGSFQGKKFSRAMEGALLELRQMQRFLPEESKSVLDQELDELQKTGMRVLDQQGRDRMRSDAEQRLNTQMRRIQRDFSFDEVSSVLLEPSS